MIAAAGHLGYYRDLSPTLRRSSDKVQLNRAEVLSLPVEPQHVRVLSLNLSMNMEQENYF